MEFQIDFIDNADHDQTVVIDAPNATVAQDIFHAANPNSTIMYVTSEECPGFDDDEPDESMDGDHDSAMTSCGWGTDEDYGYYGDDY